MLMAKATAAELEAVAKLANAWDQIEAGWDPSDEEVEREFDIEDPESCQRVLSWLIGTFRPEALSRVANGMQVLLDPANEIVDPDLDHLDLHPRLKAALEGGAS